MRRANIYIYIFIQKPSFHPNNHYGGTFLSCQDCSKCCKVINSRKYVHVFVYCRNIFYSLSNSLVCRPKSSVLLIPRTITNLPNLILRDQSREGEIRKLLQFLLEYICRHFTGRQRKKCLLILDKKYRGKIKVCNIVVLEDPTVADTYGQKFKTLPPKNKHFLASIYDELASLYSPP